MTNIKKRIMFFLPMMFLSMLFAQQVKTEPLAGVRSQIVFPEFTQAENRLIAEQAQIFFKELYVNQHQKNYYYGEGVNYTDHVDPAAAIDNVVKNVDNMTTAEVQTEIYKIFINQRDLHLNFEFPEPYARFMTFLPLTFTRVAVEDDFFQVRVNGLYNRYYEMSAPGQRVPAIGDIVVSYDGLPVKEAAEKLYQTGQGANVYGGFTRALRAMTFVYNGMHLVPENDNVVVGFKSAATGEEYTVNMKWMVQYTEPAPAAEAVAAAEATDKKITDAFVTMDENKEQAIYNSFVERNKLTTYSVYPSNPTNEPVVKWGLVEKDGEQYGYLKITSFVPKTSTEFAISEIIRIVNTYFQDTVGLLIDVRNNGGGSILFADKLSQLFIPHKAQAIEARLLNTDLNRQIFNESLFTQWASSAGWIKAINAVAGTDAVYTETVPFTTVEQANTYGQVYYKPVGVLANARSYSATDLFACAMQDNGAAVIYGEDPQTGAGGANVMEHAQFVQIVGAPFVTLPAGQGMRVSWRQSVRFGAHEGMLIEDHGCYADVDVSLQPSDIHDGGQAQLDKVLEGIKSKAWMKKAYVKVLDVSRELYLPQSSLYLDLVIAETEHVDLYVNDVLVNRSTVYAYGNEMNYRVELPADLAVGSINNIAVYGKGSGNEPLWNFKKVVAVVDGAKKVKIDNNGLVLDFATAENINPLTIFTFGNNVTPADGWTFNKPFLTVGLTPAYKDQLYTDAFVVVDLSDRLTASLEFVLEGLTEENFDFLEVFVADRQTQRTLYRRSGYLPADLNVFDLSEFAGRDDVSVHFRFVSDQMVNGPGILIKSIAVK